MIAGMATELDRLLDFAERSRLPEGGFGYLGDDGTVLAGRPLETWIVARMTHVFGLAAPAGPARAPTNCSGTASRALAEGPLHDAEHGGWRSSTDDDTKAAYVHAFVAARRGPPPPRPGADGGRALLDEALAVWQTRFWDDDAGLAVEEWDRAWQRLDGLPRRQRQHARRRGDAGRGRRAAPRRPRRPPGTCVPRRCGATERVVHGWARRAGLAAARALHRRLGAVPDYNRDRPADPFRPYGVTVGHQFEWARLALHLRAVARRRRPTGCSTDAVALFDAAATRGWAADGHDGFPYTLDWDDRPVVGARMHWVLCEAVAAASVLAEVTGEQRYRDGGAAVAGARRAGLRRSRDRQLAPRADAHRRGRLGHLGRAARRVPPGPDAAARRPPGARQPRRRAPVTDPPPWATTRVETQPARVDSTSTSRLVPPDTCRAITGPTSGA